MRFDVITLFPAQFAALTEEGVVARALQRQVAQIHLHTPRDYTTDVHRTVDDRPYGGGPGMVMRYTPLRLAIEAAQAEAATEGVQSRVAYLSPQGDRLDQRQIERISAAPGWVLVAGRYEGVDERLIEDCVDEEWSIGDYVLSGGELAAMVVMDAAIRLLPGVLGHADSARQDSHSNGLLDCPHYTRPERIGECSVPEVLLSGDHQAIERWRLQQALGRTWQRRPDLLQRRGISAFEQRLLDDYLLEAARSRPRVGSEQSE
ncbi:tRNA (guanosine(37)-N1)-methyltransferase TrmD [Halochromatium roseum]|uniref:tRNA (guanosine(37)-N1)-methyltransferase TrmD n=1 Tax=Halochromatium roseum TaxID=391920 RepID=UPI00191419B2|nr:tRNA (guanosine(37)-N1)-methyltransferase TrmD [Halochromatium roseum]MBK5939554.1 tRNA (guanosine(37)-N1)-methyltransferase TrmD [Halochromatium roseum]